MHDHNHERRRHREPSGSELKNVSVDNVPDALIKITTTNIYGSDLHMYEGRTDVKLGNVLIADCIVDVKIALADRFVRIRER